MRTARIATLMFAALLVAGVATAQQPQPKPAPAPAATQKAAGGM